MEDEKVKLDKISAKGRARKPDVFFAICFEIGTFVGQLGWQWMHQTVDFPSAMFQGLFVGTSMYPVRRLLPGLFGLK